MIHKYSQSDKLLLILDTILQEKINLEIEDFKFSLQNVLSEQQARVYQLIQMAPPAHQVGKQYD